jgi:hypothetical protein
MQHEYDCHRQHLEWRCMYRTCPADAVIFLSEDDFRAHMVDHHRVSPSNSVLLLIAKTCRQVVASRPDADIYCPICLLSIPNKRSKIGRHLGRHMEDIALPIVSLVVPTDGDTDASDKGEEETNSDNEDRPPYPAGWPLEIRAEYDQFLHDERNYVATGILNRFPPGSRLFVGMILTIYHSSYARYDN